MKTNYVLLFLLIAALSCCTSSGKPLSDTDKYLMKTDVKQIVNTIIKGCEEAKFEMAMASFVDSPDFRYIVNGSIFTYRDVVSEMKPMFDLLANQKVTLFTEAFSFPDNSTVLYTCSSRWEMNYKDGHSTIAEPMAWFLLFKKIDKKWKVIYGVESYFEKNVDAKSM